MKKTFVLLEVLIGLALVSMTILPFLRYPYQHMRDEINMLFDMELHKYGQTRLAKIETLLRMNQIDEQFIFPTKIDTEKIYSDEKYSLSLQDDLKRHYREKIVFKSSAQKQNKDRLKSSLVHTYVRYYFKGKKIAEFHSELVVQKKV